LFVLCAGAYGCARLAGGPARGVGWRAWLTGLVLGLVPFTKLQGVPIGLALAGIALVCLLVRFRGQGRRRLGAVLALAAGGLTPAALVALYLGQQGLFAHFWASYIQGNLAYAGTSSGRSPYVKLLDFLDYAPPYLIVLFYPYFRATILLGLLVLGLPGIGRTPRRLLLAGVVVLLASIYAVITPDTSFSHYLLFLLCPLAFLAAVVLAVLLEAVCAPARSGRLLRLGVVTVVLASAVAVVSVRAHTHGNLFLGDAPAGGPRDPVVELIRQYADPGERLAVWGWMDRYYVQTGLRQATAHCNSFLAIVGGKKPPPEDYFYRRYLREFAEAKPPVFVDAVGLAMFFHENRVEEGHENYPELQALVAARYELVGEFYQTRVYVSKERLAQRGLNGSDLREVPFLAEPVESVGVQWQDGTAGCAGPDSPYLGFALKRPTFVRAVRMTFAYAADERPAVFSLNWRARGRNDFGEDRYCRVTLPTGAAEQPLTIPVNDTISDFRIYPDDQEHPGGGYHCRFKLSQLSLLVRPADGPRLEAEYGEPEVPVPLEPSELHGLQWQDRTARRSHPLDQPPYLQFALPGPQFLRALHLTYAYPETAGPCQFCLFWRERGRNDFAEERCHRLRLPAGPEPRSLLLRVNDTVTDLRLYPDDTQRLEGYACVFRLERLGLLPRPTAPGGKVD
jgi:hypothetical protein